MIKLQQSSVTQVYDDVSEYLMLKEIGEIVETNSKVQYIFDKCFCVYHLRQSSQSSFYVIPPFRVGGNGKVIVEW